MIQSRLKKFEIIENQQGAFHILTFCFVRESPAKQPMPAVCGAVSGRVCKRVKPKVMTLGG